MISSLSKLSKAMLLYLLVAHFPKMMDIVQIVFDTIVVTILLLMIRGPDVFILQTIAPFVVIPLILIADRLIMKAIYGPVVDER